MLPLVSLKSAPPELPDKTLFELKALSIIVTVEAPSAAIAPPFPSEPPAVPEVFEVNSDSDICKLLVVMAIAPPAAFAELSLNRVSRIVV